VIAAAGSGMLAVAMNFRGQPGLPGLICRWCASQFVPAAGRMDIDFDDTRIRRDAGGSVADPSAVLFGHGQLLRRGGCSTAGSSR
jgi:hypothetical protein